MRGVADPGHILIIRPSALGDVCRSVPVLASLKRGFPDARIDWLVQDLFGGAVEHHPDLNKVVPFPRQRFARPWRPAVARELWGWLRGLKRERYDLVVDAQGLFRSGFFAWATRAPRRVGYANAPEGAAWFYSDKRFVSREKHAVDRMLELVAHAGAEPVRDMRLYTGEAERARATELVGEGRLAVLAPTSRWASKRWHIDRFAELAGALLEHGIERIAVVGGAGEREQCAPLLLLASREPRVIDLVGETSVAELMAVVERASLVVANDSAVLHMAVGFDRPLVALFGPTYVPLVGPYGREGDVIQHVKAGEVLDHKDAKQAALMERIGVDEVVAAAQARLAQSSRAAKPQNSKSESHPFADG